MTDATWRICSGCHKKKPITEFSRRGKRPECKSCNAAYQRRLRAETRTKEYPRAKDKYEVLDDAALAKYSAETPACFKNFVDDFWPDEQLPEHALEWVAAALTHRRLLLNVPPGHAKTSIMAVRFTIWQIALDRNKNILIFSKTTKLGEKIARAIAQEFEHNDRLNMAFGRFKAPEGNRWSVGLGELMVDGKDPGTGDLSVLCRGWNQQALGFRADQVIADDPTDRRMATSDSDRDKQRDWMVGEVETRLKPSGRIFCIGQRVHVDDLYGWLAQKYNEETGEYVWTQIETPAVIDWDKKQMLWPEQWSWDRVQEMRWSMGEGDFNCYYQQNPAAGGHFFKEWWFAGTGTAEYPGCFDYERSVGNGWKLPEGQQIPVTRVVAIDPSPTQYCGMVVADVIYQGVLGMEFWAAVVDIRREKMGQREMTANLIDLWSLYRPQAVVFEQNSVKWLHEDPEWNRVTKMFTTVIPHNTGQNKNSEEMGVWSLASDVQQGRIRFPAATDDDVELSNLLIDEMLAYPRSNKTSDVLMAMWLIKFNYKHLIPADAYYDAANQRRAWNMRKKSERGAWSRELIGG